MMNKSIRFFHVRKVLQLSLCCIKNMFTFYTGFLIKFKHYIDMQCNYI